MHLVEKKMNLQLQKNMKSKSQIRILNEACQISVVGNLFCIIPLLRWTKYTLVIFIDMLHLSLTFNGNIAFNLKAKEREVPWNSSSKMYMSIKK